MAKRFRDFRRLAMTAQTANWIMENIVDSTFKDHYDKCEEGVLCYHLEFNTLGVARMLESGFKIGKRRATLDIHCPWSQSDPVAHKKLLLDTCERFADFSVKKLTSRKQKVIERLVEEIRTYANRNEMQVIAEAASD